MNDIAPGIGHNRGLDPYNDIQAEIAVRQTDLVKRRDELLAARERLPEVVDDDAAGKVSDYVKLIAAAIKNTEAARVKEKEPWLEAGRLCDGWFKKVTDPLASLKREVEAKLTVYLRAKADAERQRREAEERAARAAAEKAAEDARRQAEAMASEMQMNGALEAEEKARAAEALAAKAAQAATAKPAEMARTRGDYGALGTLRQEWVFSDLDRDALDLEALRPYLPVDGIEKALRGFIKAGGRELRGVRIHQTETAVVR